MNYNFKTEFVSLKKLGCVDGLSRLIPKFTELLEDMVTATLRDEKELSVLICNMIRELPVSLEDIKKAAEKGEFIKKNKETGMAD